MKSDHSSISASAGLLESPEAPGIPAPSPYCVIDLAYRQLESGSLQPPTALLAIRELCKLGLGVPARELMDRFGRELEAHVNQDALRRAVAGIPSGRLPAQTCDEIFHRSLAAWRQSLGEPPDDRSLIEHSHRSFQLFRDVHGRIHISRRESAAPRRWIPAFTDYAQYPSFSAPTDQLSRSVAVVGLLPTNAVEGVWDETRTIKNHGRPPLFLIEPDADRVAAWLMTADRSALFADRCVHAFFGPGALTRLEQFLHENPDVEPPAVALNCLSSAAAHEAVTGIIRDCHAARGQLMKAVISRIEARAAQRTPAQWLDRIRPGSTVLGLTSRFTTMLQYSMRDIGMAFESLGYKFVRMMENDDDRVMTSLTISRAVELHDPSLVVMLNHFRCEQARHLGDVPVLTWVQDPTDRVLCSETGRSIGELDFVCGYYLDRCVKEFDYPASRFFSVILPVSTAMFHDAAVDDASIQPCDLVYVGHLHHDEASHIAGSRKAAPPAMHPFMDVLDREVRSLHAAGEHLQFPGQLVDRVAAEHRIALRADHREQLANLYVYRLFDILFRRQSLHWAARWAARTGRSFRIYGNGWSADPALAPFSAGPIEHGEPLRRVYRTARLVLQTMPSGFMHQRSFEGIASGSLVIARFTPESFGRMSIAQFEATPPGQRDQTNAASLFPRLSEVTFANEDEFRRLCDRCLSDDPYRTQLQASMRDTVLARLTYVRMIDLIIRWMRDGGPAPFNTPRQPQTPSGATSPR